MCKKGGGCEGLSWRSIGKMSQRFSSWYGPNLVKVIALVNALCSARNLCFNNINVEGNNLHLTSALESRLIEEELE